MHRNGEVRIDVFPEKSGSHSARIELLCGFSALKIVFVLKVVWIS